ncbi:PR domain zinc finger protein 15 [Armadillidium vulgare]|nr:PR domain zinc finger protein 15 [Armadillidium vulgare]
MGSVFESVQAILKEDVRQYLKEKADIYLNLKAVIDGYKETLQVFETENGLTTLIGSLKAILISQKFLSSYLKEEEEDLRIKFNLPEVDAPSKNFEYEIPKLEEASICRANNNFLLKDTNKCKLEPKCDLTSHSVGFDTRTNDIGFVSSSHRIQESNIYRNSNHFSTLYPSTRGNIRVTTSLMNIPSKYSCESCPFKSSREKLLLKHLKYHKKKEDSHAQISCVSCVEYFTRVSDYEEHMKSKHKERKQRPNELCKGKGNEVEKNLRCEICSHEAGNGSEYKKHLDSHHPTIYSCSKCEYKTKKKMHYIRHVKNVHENVRPFICQVCGDAFKRQDSLRQHQFIHSREAKTEARFQCEVCNKVFRSANYLREHMLTHSNVRSFLCEICGASFKTRPVHRNHMKVVHSQILQATCKICGKTFSTKYSLKRHVLQHENRYVVQLKNVYRYPFIM